MNNANHEGKKHHFEYGIKHLEEELRHDHKENEKTKNLFAHKIAPAIILIATLCLAVAFILFFSNSSPAGKTNKERISQLLGKTAENNGPK